MAFSQDEHASIAALEHALSQLPIDCIDVGQPRLFELGVADQYLARLRREAPVHFCGEGMFGPFWSVTRHKDIETVELDPETYSSDHANGGITIGSHPDEPQFFPSLIAMDPPRHALQRRVIAPAFSNERLGVMSARLREWVADILSALPRDEPFDWVDRVSVELTARTLALLLGYPQEHARNLIRWSEAMVALVGSPSFPTLAAKLRVMQECFDAFGEIWQQRQADPSGDDLLSMLASQPETREMSRAELYGNIVLLIVGGNDTSRSTISGSVVALDRYPAELAKLRENPELLANLTPEVLRWQTPIAHMRRTAMRETDLGGQRIARGDKVVLWYLSGNRDEDIFERPSDFWIERPNSRRHLAFGAGIHRCIGARLADLQLRIVWEEILLRFGRIAVLQPPRRSYSTFTHGFTELQVAVTGK